MPKRASGTFDASLAVAASRLVEASLCVVPGEVVLIVHDESHKAIAEVVADAVMMRQAEAIVVALDTNRPHDALPPAVRDAMGRSQASVLLVDFHRGELAMRTEMVDAAARHRLRHGHMVGVTRASMAAGFSVDPNRIAEKIRAVMVRLRPDARIAVRSEAGTDLAIELTPSCRWVEYGCTVQPGRRVNLPGGEIITCPKRVDGTYVADGTLGDADGALNRSLKRTPISLRIVSSRVVEVKCAEDPNLAGIFSARMARHANLDRIGLAGFGVNIGLTAPVGDVFTDQKVPGVHLSLGETFQDRTGAAWTSKSWIGVTCTESDVDIDGAPILRRGRFLI